MRHQIRSWWSTDGDIPDGDIPGIIEYDFIGTKSMFQTATAALDQTKQNPLANK